MNERKILRDELLLRNAVEEDSEEILQMQANLAEYCGYNMAHFALTEDKIRETINNTESWARYTIAEGELAPGYRAIAGMMLSSKMPTFAWTAGHPVYVEDLYIKEKFRGRGIGVHFIAQAARRALELADGDETTASVRLDTAHHNNDHTLHFYKELGFDNHNTNLRLSGERILQLAEYFPTTSVLHDEGMYNSGTI